MNPEHAARLQARYARRANPIGLTVDELDFGQFPAKNGFPGIPVKAWIRFPNCAELVDGEVYAWTAKAAEVTWQDGPLTYRTWVWSSAVTRREEMMNRNLGERADRDTRAPRIAGEAMLEGIAAKRCPPGCSANTIHSAGTGLAGELIPLAAVVLVVATVATVVLVVATVVLVVATVATVVLVVAVVPAVVAMVVMAIPGCTPALRVPTVVAVVPGVAGYLEAGGLCFGVR
jgi:hypothetical protein